MALIPIYNPQTRRWQYLTTSFGAYAPYPSTVVMEVDKLLFGAEYQDIDPDVPFDTAEHIPHVRKRSTEGESVYSVEYALRPFINTHQTQFVADTFEPRYFVLENDPVNVTTLPVLIPPTPPVEPPMPDILKNPNVSKDKKAFAAKQYQTAYDKYLDDLEEYNNVLLSTVRESMHSMAGNRRSVLRREVLHLGESRPNILNAHIQDLDDIHKAINRHKLTANAPFMRILPDSFEDYDSEGMKILEADYLLTTDIGFKRYITSGEIISGGSITRAYAAEYVEGTHQQTVIWSGKTAEERELLSSLEEMDIEDVTDEAKRDLDFFELKFSNFILHRHLTYWDFVAQILESAEVETFNMDSAPRSKKKDGMWEVINLPGRGRIALTPEGFVLRTHKKGVTTLKDYVEIKTRNNSLTNDVTLALYKGDVLDSYITITADGINLTSNESIKIDSAKTVTMLIGTKFEIRRKSDNTLLEEWIA
jgi:hypothetical protein